ncbi:unnamed protein product, partial [Allacma fusca]
MRIFWLSLLLLFSSAFANTDNEQISFEEDAEEIPTNVKDDTALMLENDYQNGIGTRVVRGPDWKWDDQDGAPGQE